MPANFTNVERETIMAPIKYFKMIENKKQYWRTMAWDCNSTQRRSGLYPGARLTKGYRHIRRKYIS